MLSKIKTTGLLCSLCLLIGSSFVLVGCPDMALRSAEMTVVINGGLAVDTVAKDGDDEVPRDSIAAVYVVVDEIKLEQLDGSFVTIFTGPFEVDILSLQGIGTVMAAVDIPPGSYAGGIMVLSSADVEFVDNPGVRVPLVIPDSGQFYFEHEFAAGEDSYGILKLHLDDIEIYVLEDQSLQFWSRFEFEAEIEEPEDDDETPVQIGTVDAQGIIEDLELEDCELELELYEKGELDVDICSASILLPPLVEGDAPIAGVLEDLMEDACVRVTGQLFIQDDDLVVVADTVEILAYDCGDDDDDDDDGDDDDDDDDD